MEFSRKEIFSRQHKIPEISFEDHRLTSFAGAVIYQVQFLRMRIKEQLRSCFSHLGVSEIFGHHITMMMLIVHLLLGYRKLRDMEQYKDDPMVKRLLGLRRLPDVSTVSRALRSADEECIRRIRAYCRTLVLTAAKKVMLQRITLDFDGSVLTTQGRNIEGTAVGYNKKRKGARSYYPLFCTLAQTGQVFDVYHRPGNVHDSRGVKEFIIECISIIKKEMLWVTIEVRRTVRFSAMRSSRFLMRWTSSLRHRCRLSGLRS